MAVFWFRVTGLLIVAVKALRFSFGVRALPEMEDM